MSACCPYSKLLTSRWLLFTLLCVFVQNKLSSQENNTIILNDNEGPGLVVSDDTITKARADSLLLAGGLSAADTILNDSLTKPKAKPATLETTVERTAADSIRHDFRKRMVYLYGDAKIVYGDITLEAAVIEINFLKNEVFAYGIIDSTGKLTGTPVFTESGQTFEAKTITYNFDSKKGMIYSVFTEDGQGYLHGKKVKKMTDNSINIQSGAYTTCNNRDHPHFEFRFNRAKVIPDNKIITGPAFMAIEGMPTPLAVPFGMFPNNTGQRSGIMVPTYGESDNRGFYFENGGYYWAINEYLDLNILGDIYTRGSWAIKPTLRYTKRYKYNGTFNTSYAINITGSEGAPDYQRSRDFRVRWTHRQDPKARPAGRFSADVFVVSSNFNKFNPVSAENYLSNEFKSSVAYQTNWDNKYFLTMNASHRQNTKTKIVEVSLPELTFTVNRFYPLKRKNAIGRPKWYEDLNVDYSMNARNSISLPDSLLFASDALSKMQNGIQHRSSLSLPLKLLKHFTLTNSVSLTDRMYFDSRRKYWSNDTLFQKGDTIVGYVATDTMPGFKNVFDFSVSSNLTTKVYGMVNFKKGPLRAVRHVFTPRIGISYTPDFGNEFWGYYDSYIDGNDVEQYYSRFEGSLFGSPPKDQSGRINYGFSNNLEIKIPSRKDTITGLRKVVLIEDLSISGSYDMARDSLNFSDISVRGRTRLFKNLNIQYGSTWSPYATNAAGGDINVFQWDVNKKLFRQKQTSWDFGASWNLRQQDFAKDKKPEEQAPRESEFGSEQELAEINQNPDDYVDWTVPWSLSLNYNLRYSNNVRYPDFIREDERKFVQTLGVSGEVNITPKWKFSFRTGWDFEANDLSYTSINIYRDLHCWEMRFNWIPTGFRKSWNFTINVKASILQDLKLNKKKDFRDI